MIARAALCALAITCILWWAVGDPGGIDRLIAIAGALIALSYLAVTVLADLYQRRHPLVINNPRASGTQETSLHETAHRNTVRVADDRRHHARADHTGHRPGHRHRAHSPRRRRTYMRLATRPPLPAPQPSHHRPPHSSAGRKRHHIMSWLVNAAGSGLGIVAIGVAFFLLRHHPILPGATHPWIRRLVIVLMYVGGASLAVTAIGHLADRILNDIATPFGGLATGPAHAALVIALLLLIGDVAAGLISAPDGSVAVVAVFLPILLALTTTGLLHSLYLFLNAPALNAAAALNSMIGG